VALDASKRNQRVIFFCACPTPATCHRFAVAKLVGKEVGKRGSKVEIIEWPGGEPTSLEFLVPDTLLKQARSGRRSLPLSEPVDMATFAALPWYSCVKLKSDQDSLQFLSGPAIFSRGRWHLPCLTSILDEPLTPSSMVKDIRDRRKAEGYDAIL
jgi:hypothetical protein